MPGHANSDRHSSKKSLSDAVAKSKSTGKSPVSYTIKLVGVPCEVNTEELQTILEAIGPVSSVQLEVRDVGSLASHAHAADLKRVHGKRLQIADVEFLDQSTAASERAVALLNGLVIANTVCHARLVSWGCPPTRARGAGSVPSSKIGAAETESRGMQDAQQEPDVKEAATLQPAKPAQTTAQAARSRSVPTAIVKLHGLITPSSQQSRNGLHRIGSVSAGEVRNDNENDLVQRIKALDGVCLAVVEKACQLLTSRASSGGLDGTSVEFVCCFARVNPTPAAVSNTDTSDETDASGERSSSKSASKARYDPFAVAEAAVPKPEPSVPHKSTENAASHETVFVRLAGMQSAVSAAWLAHRLEELWFDSMKVSASVDVEGVCQQDQLVDSAGSSTQFSIARGKNPLDRWLKEAAEARELVIRYPSSRVAAIAS